MDIVFDRAEKPPTPAFSTRDIVHIKMEIGPSLRRSNGTVPASVG
jgi:hypothetical protein